MWTNQCQHASNCSKQDACICIEDSVTENHPNDPTLMDTATI